MALGKSMSIEEFKTANNTVKIDIIKNPQTDKLFVSSGSKVLGAVSLKWDQSKPSEFVEIINDETGEILWCLHNQNTDNIVASL